MTHEEMARAFHEAYERLAPSFGYKTREVSAVPWVQVPEANRNLMVAVAGEVLAALESEKPLAVVEGYIGARIPKELTRKRWFSFVVHQNQHQHALWPKDTPVTLTVHARKPDGDSHE